MQVEPYHGQGARRQLVLRSSRKTNVQVLSMLPSNIDKAICHLLTG